MYINTDHKELVKLSIAIVVGSIFIHQSSFFIIPVIAQTSQNNLTSSIIHFPNFMK